MKDEKTADNTTLDIELIERMFTVGAHFGYSKSRRHPSVAPFIFGAKNRVEIFDLEKTNMLLVSAKECMQKLGAEKKRVLFVGGKNEARDAVREGALSLGMPHVVGRWIGGTLTNFSEIQKRIERLKNLTEKREKGEFETKYTKKERLMLDREIENLTTHFGGLLTLSELPDALLVVDTKKEHTAVTEAKKRNIPVIGLLNSDSDLSDITYPIVANDATQKSIAFFVGELVEAYTEGAKNQESLNSKAQLATGQAGIKNQE